MGPNCMSASISGMIGIVCFLTNTRDSTNYVIQYPGDSGNGQKNPHDIQPQDLTLLLEGIRQHFHCDWFISDEERDEEAEATAEGDKEEEEEQRSGSDKADSDHEEEAEKSETSAKEGSDGGLFCSVIIWTYKCFVNFQSSSSSLGSNCNLLLASDL